MNRPPVEHIVRMVLAAAVASLLWSATAQAASTENASEPGIRIPVLGGHRFQQSSVFGDPFVRTYVRNSTGIGKAVDLETPLYDFFGDPAGSLKGDVLFLTVDFEYMHAVKDWVGLWLDFKALGRLGTNEQSLLGQGITTLTSMQIGWLFRLYEGDRWMLSGTVNMWNSDLLSINLLDWVDRIIDDGGLSPDNNLVSKTPSLRAGVGLRAAYAPNDLFGFTGLLETGGGESLRRSRTGDGFINFGLHGDIDLRARTAVPIGFVAAYYVTTFPEQGDKSSKHSNTFAFRINFTGRKDFLVGLESITTRTKLPDIDGVVTSSLLTIQLHYYF